MRKPRFRLVTIKGRNSATNKKCRLSTRDSLCWVNPTNNQWEIRFSKKSPLVGFRSFKLKAGKASRWYKIKKGLNKDDIFRYRIGPPGDPDGPAIISEGG